MKIIIFGLGYVGLTSAACAIKEGHSVIGVDIDKSKIDALNEGCCPIYEPGLAELLGAGLKSGRFSAVLDPAEDYRDADIALICVGTPSQSDGSHNMTYIATVSKQIGLGLKKFGRNCEPLTIALRSTVRPGTMDQLISPVLKGVLGGKASFELVYNPEFLRESTAIKDYFNPPKIVVGTSNGERNRAIDSLYENISAPVFYTKFKEAEITKFVDNSFHAVKVTFANEIGRICHRLGISASKVHEIFVSDTKLNISPYYLRPGNPFGGSCLPKDVRAITYISSSVAANTQLLDSLIRSNKDHTNFLVSEIMQLVGDGAKVLFNGISFKENSDDLRESPYVDIAQRLLDNGLDVDIYDPHVKPEALIGSNLGYQLVNFPSLSECLKDSGSLLSEEYDLIVDARGTAKELPISSAKIYSLNSMS